MSTRPLVGVTTYCRTDYCRTGDNDFTLPAEYVEAVERAGGLPVLVAPTGIAAEEWLSRLDAIILAGGGDLDPTHYGGEPHETIYSVNAERDQSELRLARDLVASKVPTLGICRGAQVLNVALGGTLIAHIPDVVGPDVVNTGIEHRLPPREPTPHDIAVDAGSRLAAILGKLEFSAASWHHQALKDVPSSVRVVARAPDGIVEAFEMPSHPWLLAVQWHPELTAAQDPVQQRLFDALIEAARAEGRGRD